MDKKAKVLMKGKFNYSSSKFKKMLVRIFLVLTFIFVFLFGIEIINSASINLDGEVLLILFGTIYFVGAIYLSEIIYEKLFLKEVVITKYTNGIKILIDNDEIIIQMNKIRRVKAELSYGVGSRGSSKGSSRSSTKLVIYTNTEVFHFTTLGINEGVKKVESYINKGIEINT
ncbi:hypothetical protein ATZ33_10540 [Enterococcus silesiacus]|uniref:DUF304 domain-containing protein n=1 Tax=Enterococcus silesiacus TaxID=332949 RepID=A0ABM5W940_9ENTE|nr:hypothetical protein [Enterococcus silesiacus]ALS01796.1 hypothetical protein ATZ33_10540 [Enterococcus silesiacus]